MIRLSLLALCKTSNAMLFFNDKEDIILSDSLTASWLTDSIFVSLNECVLICLTLKPNHLIVFETSVNVLNFYCHLQNRSEILFCYILSQLNFKSFLKMSMLDDTLMDNGNTFQSAGATTEKAWSPLRLNRDRGTVRSIFWEERRWHWDW